MEILPYPQFMHPNRPETRGFSKDGLRDLSATYPELKDLLDTEPPTTKSSPVVLLTGAGAARPLDMPTMVEFREEFPKCLAQPEKALWGKMEELAAKYFEEQLGRINIEHMLTYIDECEESSCAARSLWYGTYGPVHGDATIEQLHEFRQKLWSIRMAALDRLCDIYGSPDPSKVAECYTPLFEMLKNTGGQTVTNVFTTNYDLTFELLALRKPAEFEVVDGFVKCPSGDEVYKAQYVPKYEAGHSIVLWKLHGSTSWKGQIAKLQFRKTTPGQYMQGEDRTIIVYPSMRKGASQDFYVSPFSQAYGGLTSMLCAVNQCKVLLVIGYRFGDKEIVEVLERGLKSNTEAEIIVVDPQATTWDVKKAFLNISENRFRIVPYKFGEAATLDTIAKEIQTSLSS